MTRKPYLTAVLVNGIPMVQLRRESLLEAYGREQRECPHAKRDPKGTCYRCGQREVA